MGREVELKLSMPARTAAHALEHPLIARHAPQPVSRARLLSVYYDTPAGDLRAAEVALRLRRGDAGWVQTVKWAGSALGGLHQRGELEAAVDGQRLDPTMFLDPRLPAVLRSTRIRSRLQPVFVSDFARATRLLRLPSGTEIEACADRGHLIAGTARAPLCELELELVDGSALDLFDLALELAPALRLHPSVRSKAERGYALAGVTSSAPVKAQAHALHPDDSLPRAFRTILASGLQQLQANEEGMLAAGDPEYLHQMRVALRRLRSGFGAFAKALPETPLSTLGAELKWLGRQLGAARDWDVFVTELLPPLQACFADDADIAALVERARTLRARANRTARATIRSRRYVLLILALGRLAAVTEPVSDAGANERPAPVFAFAGRLLERRWDKARARGRRLDGRSLADLHRLRIALKKLRYAVEFFACLYPRRRAARFRDRLVALQDCLGHINDAGALQRLGHAAVPEHARTGTLLAGWSARMVYEERRRLVSLWHELKHTRKFW